MGNEEQRMRHLIMIFCFAVFPLLGSAQEVDSIKYCSSPDEDAKPPFKMHELFNIIMDNHHNQMPDCFDPNSQFYYNITILDDGTVEVFNLECVINGQSCFITVDDVSKLEKWTPAIANGQNCNQKMRIKTYIHFE